MMLYNPLILIIKAFFHRLWKALNYAFTIRVSLGLEVCNAEEYGQYEIHVTGDVSLGFQQYLYMSSDIQPLLHERLKEAVLAIADFWKHRAAYSQSTDSFGYLGMCMIKCWTNIFGCSQFHLRIKQLYPKQHSHQL